MFCTPLVGTHVHNIVKPEILVQILFGGYAKNVANWYWQILIWRLQSEHNLLFIDNAPPTNQNHVYVLAKLLFVCKREPTCKNPTCMCCAVMVNSNMVFMYRGKSLQHAHCFCTEMKALFMWTMQLMEYTCILADFNLVVCFQNRQSAKLIFSSIFQAVQ